MKKVFYLTISLLIAASSCTKDQDNNEQDLTPGTIELTAGGAGVITANNDFGIDLFARTASEENKNFMISPLSAGVALTMLLNGCEGATYDQLNPILNDRKKFDRETLHPGRCAIGIGRRMHNDYETANLLGCEIKSRIPAHLKNKIIVIGAANSAAENEASVADTRAKVQAFQAGRINQLTWIVPANGNTHWIAARTLKTMDGSFDIAIADSAGFDQKENPEVLNIIDMLSGRPTVRPMVPATEAAPSVKKPVAAGPAKGKKHKQDIQEVEVPTQQMHTEQQAKPLARRARARPDIFLPTRFKKF